MQRDLYAEPLKLTPAPGRAEPRLWVRRLIIWNEPGQELRNIELKPGLNIVWSPDDGSQRGQIGHGGGKTTFCRLLRYCLGEAFLGPLEQRKAIADKVPMASVGAEIRLDGETWLIKRGLDNASNDWALKGNSFADVGALPSERTGMKPFRDAVTRAFLGDALALVPTEIGDDDAWQALLAWLSRDQECRFAHLLDWRDADSGSGSPVSGRGRSQEDREAIVRIVIDALRLEEIQTKRQQEAANIELRNLGGQLSKLEWRRDELRGRLVQGLGLNGAIGAELGVVALTNAASERLAQAQGGAAVVTPELLASSRDEVERAAERLSQLRSAAEIAASKKESADQLARLIGDELPELSAANQRLAQPICPICHVVIDKARAEGCGISLQSCDLDALQKGVQERRKAREAALAEACHLADELQRFKPEIALAEQQHKQSRDALVRLESAALARSDSIRRAERTADEVSDLEQVEAAIADAETAVAETEDRVKALGAELINHRAAVAAVIGGFSDRFDAVFRELIPNNPRCVVKLDGNGLGIGVPVKGAAIESLKATVFDLAAMTFAIEGKTRHPGFLIHDSPREADLGRQIYDSLFEVVEKLESFGSAPLFQYVVTTTTAPPDRYQSYPPLCLTLRGAPADERLFKADL